MKRILLCLFVFALLVACSSNVPTVPATAPASQPELPAQASAATAPATTPAAPVLAPCSLTVDRIKALCQLTDTPVKGDGCFFQVNGVKTGNVSVTKVAATEAEYLAAYGVVYTGPETYELKPRSARGEKVPYSYFFWWTGKDLITAKAQTLLCATEKLKKIVQEFEQVQTAAS